MAGFNVLTDPMFSERCSPVQWAGPSRMAPPALSIPQLPPIDAVVLTHNHYDHLDEARGVVCVFVIACCTGVW